MKLPNNIIEELKQLMIVSGKKGNLPNGAVLIDSKTHKLLASSPSLVATKNDATAHAERLVISQYCQKIKKPFFENAILITVFEPCLMCLSAAYWAGIKEVWFIIPASAFWDKIPWMAEGKKLNKQKILKKFNPPLTLKHLSAYEKEFTQIAEAYLERVIKRK